MSRRVTRKIKWTEEEDRLLTESVKKIGERKWRLVAEAVPGRDAKQCRERWLGMISPKIDSRPFDPDEDRLLIEKQQELGNKWTLIGEFLPGRSPTMLKNRWNWLRRRRFEVKDDPEHFNQELFSGDTWKELDKDSVLPLSSFFQETLQFSARECIWSI